MISFNIGTSNTPVLAIAIHAGHQVRQDLLTRFELDEETRLREEDPFTDRWTSVSDSWLIVNQSRFEVDINRPREKAVYLKPEDAWGLKIWKSEPTKKMVSQSLAFYDHVYATINDACLMMQSKYKHFVIFDLHTYNHRRGGPLAQPASPDLNPEINLGTGTNLSKDKWRGLTERFIKDIKAFNFEDRELDIRENIKFLGGNVAKTIHESFSESACVFSVEIKKTFMDEWTGEPNHHKITLFQEALNSTLPGIKKELKQL